MKGDFIESAVDRMISLLEKDDELRTALIRLINGKAAHEEALARRAANVQVTYSDTG